jgi:propanediol dehydratase small subunit
MTGNIDANLEDLTLGSVCDGVLEEQFQERIHEVLKAFDDHARLATKAGRVFATIPLEVELIYEPSDRTLHVTACALRPKLPKPKAIMRSAFRREGGLKVQPEPVQEEIPGTLHPIRNGAE